MNKVYPTYYISVWPSFENRNASGWKFNYTQTSAETHQKCVWIFNDATLFGYLGVETQKVCLRQINFFHHISCLRNL